MDVIGKLLGRKGARLPDEIEPVTDGRAVPACASCDVEEGQLHELFCEYERCPFCGGQLASCECSYEKLGLLDRSKFTEATSFLPPEIYEHGLPEDLEDKWCELLESKGRVPFIKYPNVCAKCGVLYPEFFRVSNEEWEKYIEIEMRGSIICKACYSYIKHVVNLHANDA
jgi:hypothetical protein